MTMLRQGTGFLTLLAFITLLTGCGWLSGGKSQPKANSDDNKPGVTITVAKSEGREVASTIQATGSLVAFDTSDVAPKVSGKVINISVEVGQYVRSGAVLAKLDDSGPRLSLASARASVRQAEANVRQAEARLGLHNGGQFNASTVPEVSAANAAYQQALAELKQAEANESRYRDLAKSGDVSMVVYEGYRTTRDTARARANAAKEQMNSAINTARQSDQAIASARASVQTAKANADIAEKAVADTVIHAPFAGYIGSRPTAVGEFVSTASVVASILRTDPIKVQIQVPEADVPYLAVGRGVSLQIDAYKDRKFAGTVSAIEPSLDVNSRAVIVEATVPNGDNALRPGMFVTAQISRQGGAAGVFVPKAAVMRDPTTASYRVFVIEDGSAKLRVVQLGIEEGDVFQILSGVNADETVATSNLDQLYEGARVSY